MRAKEFVKEISPETVGRFRDENFLDLDTAYKELRGWKRFVPPLKRKLKKDIEKANRRIRRADDYEINKLEKMDREFVDKDKY